jgi:lipopolysaccharide/colanic/teichoic acid biosynthesis glycosyltransferase
MVYERTGKRWLDLSLASVALLLASPLMLLAAVAIALDDGFPVLFRQIRVGRDGRTFNIFKFRSMPVATPSVPSAAARTFSVTRMGAFLRRSNIDELPQLFNVLAGEMSLVGPRPGLPSQTALHDLRRQRGVDRLRPGLTGLAQVNAFDGMSEIEKVEWEARYAARVSLWRDLSIMLRTAAYLFRRPPVY